MTLNTRAPLSDWELPPERVEPGTTGTFGERLTGALLSTQLAKGRLGRAKRLSGADERQVVASASAEVLLTEDAPTLLSWLISEASANGTGRHLASSRNLRDERGTEKAAGRVRPRIFEHALRTFEQDAGVERHQRGGHAVTFVPLTELNASASVESAFEAIEYKDLLERAKLSPRQRQVLALNQQGLTGPQIAEKLGIAVSTADNHLAEGRKKIREAT